MHPVARELIGLLGRMGTRAVAEAVASVAEDVDSVAVNVSKKARRVKKKAKSIPRERVEEELDE